MICWPQLFTIRNFGYFLRAEITWDGLTFSSAPAQTERAAVENLIEYIPRGLKSWERTATGGWNLKRVP